MKKFISVMVLSAVMFMSSSASAARTMDLVDEYRDGSQKICVYSDGRYTVTTTKSPAGACPSKHTEH